MLRTFKERREQEEGFTLIELMVVVLIIAILLAIAIPTFLGARDRANDRAAQSSLRNALTAAKTIYTDDQTYASAATSAQLLAVENSLTYGTGDSTGFKNVSVAVSSDGSAWGGAALSKSKTCFKILDLSGASGGTFYGSTPNAGTTCQGVSTGITGAKW